jgi:uncharacterized protein YaaN involved in tellurite resistance
MRKRVHRFRAKFETVAAQIDRITVELERRVDTLRRDVTMLDGLHEQTRQSIGELDVYIAAGKAYAEEFRRTELPRLQGLVTSSGEGTQDLMAAQAYQDAVQALDRLEKRVLYLQQARQIGIQQLPQIRIVQNGDATLIESLQASINLTIPAWKQKMVLLLGLTRQQEALALQKTVTGRHQRHAPPGFGDDEDPGAGHRDPVPAWAGGHRDPGQDQPGPDRHHRGRLTVQSEGRRKRVQVEQEMERQTEQLRQTLARAPRELV